jgi:hypothetical protein
LEFEISRGVTDYNQLKTFDDFESLPTSQLFGLRRQSVAATALSECAAASNIQFACEKAVSRFACHRSPNQDISTQSCTS